MSTGRLTIPTDKDYVEGTKKFIKLWGADAIRDCDGVSLPDDLKQFNCGVYKAYFMVREDHEYALKHKEYWQNIAITTDRYLALEDTLTIELTKGLFKESIEVNLDRYKEFWQVYDRTTGILHKDWEYVGNDCVKINNCIKFHEYTVNFFAINCWDPVQIYNYHVNNWTCPKDIDLDPIYPEALSHMLERMENWLKNNPDITVVRFTTFFYNFLILNETGIKAKWWDWHNYAMTASPKMFDTFYKETGIKMCLEDLIDGGYLSNRFRIPNDNMRKYIDFVQKKCAGWAKQFVDLCHKYNKQAMMFDGDHRIGVEPYSPYFEHIGLDAVVGAPSSSVYIQQIANMKSVKYTEGRLNPYFFPNECPGDEKGTQILTCLWNGMRRGLLKKTIDRIGFGGYLKQVENYSSFVKKVTEVCNEFRNIKDVLGNNSCKTKGKVAVLTYWGRLSSWMLHGTFVDDTRQDGYFYNSFIFALSVLPFDVDFISFEDVEKNDLTRYNVIISDGITGTAFHGDECWTNTKVLEKLKEYVYNGGSFLGVGEPTGYQFQGRFFQLSDVLGVEKECQFTHFQRRDQVQLNKKHWITEDINMNNVAFNDKIQGVYPLTAQLLYAHFNNEYPYGAQNACNADFALNTFGNGRSAYFSGISNNNDSFRLIYKTLLWLSKKEDEYKKYIAENVNVDVFYYDKKDVYAIYNTTDKKITTNYYDKDSNKKCVELKPYEIKWVNN